MTRLGSDRLVVQERLHDGRLLALTAALLCAPLVVGASAALGRGTDTVLLVTSLLVMVPLVMARIRGLVQEREAAQAALAHQATHDALTGLLNRAELLARLDAARERVAMGVSPGLCLIFLDLDGFKQVNDTFGHAAGDLLLKVVAERCARVRACRRRGGPLGGDEFVVLWEQADAQHAQVLATASTRHCAGPSSWTPARRGSVRASGWSSGSALDRGRSGAAQHRGRLHVPGQARLPAVARGRRRHPVAPRRPDTALDPGMRLVSHRRPPASPAVVDVRAHQLVVDRPDGVQLVERQRRDLGGSGVRPGLLGVAGPGDHDAHTGLVDHPAQREGRGGVAVRGDGGDPAGGLDPDVVGDAGEGLATSNASPCRL
jgi:diguanylate cyclase (GGDEF)-like protein